MQARRTRTAQQRGGRSRYLELFKNREIEAKNFLIEHNLRLVAHIIKKYYSNTAIRTILHQLVPSGL